MSGYAEPPPATVDEFDRDAVAAQLDVAEELGHLFPGQHRRQAVVIMGADLGEHRPVLVAQLFDKEEARTSGRRADVSRKPWKRHAR